MRHEASHEGEIARIGNIVSPDVIPELEEDWPGQYDSGWAG